MATNVPVRLKRKNYIVNSVSELIMSFRLTNNLTQKKLAFLIGAYCSNSGNTVITNYENGITLPSLEYIYKISNILGIDKDAFFNMVLKEHFKRFTEKHMSIYPNFVLNKTKTRSVSYFFCTNGKIKYSFNKLFSIFKESMIKKDISIKQFAEHMSLAENGGFHPKLIRNFFYSKRNPSLKVLFYISKFLELDLFEVYKIAVEEKALAHAKNMFTQWNKYKEEIIKNEVNGQIQ